MGIEKKDPANFSPSVEIPAKVDSFRFWCQKVLPLVYDDSLSYYELLCKVVNYLNNTIADVNTLGTDVDNLNRAYNELQRYVNNYFSTLDVQEEINNKLDVMAQDGSLSALIQPLFDTYKTEINNEVNQQNNKIGVLENRMNTFTSLPSGSTSGDAELIDIRVPASGFNNNKTYANAGDAVRGQISSLKEDLNYKEPLLLNLFDYTKVTLNKYLNGETEEYNDKTYISDFIPVTKLGDYNISLLSGTVSAYGTNKTYLRTLVLENHIFNVNDKSIKFIRFNGIMDTLPFDYLYYGDKYLGYIPYNVNGFEFVSEQVRPIQKIMGGVQKTNILLVNDGSTPYYEYDSNYRVTTYEVGEYKKCRYKAKAKTGGGALICFYKSNGDFIEYNTDIYDALYDYDVYFTTPKDCAYIKTSGYFPNDGILYIEGYSTENCIYSGKTFLTVGDSRTWYDGEKFTDATKYEGITCNGYQYYLRNNLGIKTINYGVSGYTTPQIYNGVKNIPLLADNIITMCGTNDWQKNIPLGTILDIGAEFNVETTLGAYQAMIEKFINQNTKVKLFVMGEFAGWNNNLNKEESTEINTKVRELCDLYSLPFLDLLNNGRLNKLNRGELYADSDSTNLFLHPNNDGWLLMSNTINSFILVN